MRVLAVDTSTLTSGAAIAVDGEILARSEEPRGAAHSRYLLALIRDVLGEAGLTLADCDAFAASAGPGSFTGLRIGLATVNGLAYACGRPAIGVSTLEAFAWMARERSPATVVAILDARRSEVFAARFRSDPSGLARLTADTALPPLRAFSELVEGGDLVIGDGGESYAELLAAAAPGAEFLPCGAAAVAVAVLASSMPQPAPGTRAEPRYLRRPQLFGQPAAG